MEQDCTIFQTTAAEKKRFQATESKIFPKGTPLSEPDRATGPAIKMCAAVKANKRNTPAAKAHSTLSKGADHTTSWCYIFVHNKKVQHIEQLLENDAVTHFIHKSIKYVPRHRHRGGMREVETPSVSGLIFLQGNPKALQHYLDEKQIHHSLCKNCSTGKVATIPCSQMEPFMRVAETEPERLRFLLRPFVYYSKNRTLLRIISGEYAGLQGYVIRIARDRRLVMDVGGMAVALAGVHAERFEEVDKSEATDIAARSTFYKRNLHERNAFIDRYFHRVTTAQEVAAQVENIDILRLQTLKDVDAKRLDVKDAFDTFYFIIEEIGYYYAPFISYFHSELTPIFNAGRQVMAEIEHVIHVLNNAGDAEVSQRCASEFEKLKTQYGYLFE